MADDRESGISPPRELTDRWVVGGVFAEGGMAHVHIGRDRLDPKRRVAIKRLHPQYAHNQDFVLMFGDEVRITACVHHPKVVSTLDVVRGDGELFLVLEYVEGVTLAELRSLQGGALPVRPLVSVVEDLLDGLHAAHEATDELGRRLGIVHRDISPQNVIVGVDGMARVLDFGIAKAMGRFYETRGGQTKGKLAYFAPEQLRGDPVDRRADVYTTAVLLWEFLADRRLFKGRNQAETLENIRSLQVPRPSEATARTNADDLAFITALDDIVLRGLSRDPGERYPDAATFVQALRAIAPPEPSLVTEWVQQVAGSALAEKARLIDCLLSAEVEGGQPSEPMPVSLRRGDGPHPIRALVAASSEGGVSDEDSASRESSAPILSSMPNADPPPEPGPASTDKSGTWWQKAVQGVKRSGWFWVVILLPSVSATAWLSGRQAEPPRIADASISRAFAPEGPTSYNPKATEVFGSSEGRPFSRDYAEPAAASAASRPSATLPAGEGVRLLARSEASSPSSEDAELAAIFTSSSTLTPSRGESMAHQVDAASRDASTPVMAVRPSKPHDTSSLLAVGPKPLDAAPQLDRPVVSNPRVGPKPHVASPPLFDKPVARSKSKPFRPQPVAW